MAARAEFSFPTNKAVSATALSSKHDDEPCTYLCGNSLGLASKRSRELVDAEMKVWMTRGVEGHFNHPHEREWTNMTNHVHPLFAEIVGAEPSEVACMSTLTTNLHLMMSTFYRPTKARFKILCEAHAFPSDQYAFISQVKRHGLDVDSTLIEMSAREGEYNLREEDILDTIAKHGSEIALVMFSGIQYWSGQLFPIETITKKGKEMGCIVGWDLAHAVGNAPLSLHAWDVDFAVWCSYKYLNSGPGGIGGLFVHDKHAETVQTEYAGWWGHERSTRFDMPREFVPIRGAQGFQQSNPDVLSVAALLGALQTFHDAGGMKKLREYSETLTQRLWDGLVRSPFYVPAAEAARAEDKQRGFTIVTPAEPSARGAQLSLLFFPIGTGLMQEVFDGLKAHGVVGDERKPDVIRLAPVPLYNSEGDVDRAVTALDAVLKLILKKTTEA